MMPPKNLEQLTTIASARSPLLREILLAAGIFLLAVLLRVPALGQSLWYDEIHTLAAYISQHWSQIVKGEYSPNNHVLFSLLARLLTPDTSDVGDITICIRLPSLFAGSLVPIVFAWPLRRCCPKLSLGIAIIAAIHPWLITFSTWARGYALLLLLAILATNFLPTRRRLISWPYVLLATAALYTQPLAILLIAAHGLTTLIMRREIFLTWLRSASLTGILTFLLYLPFFGGARHYWSQPEQPSAPYAQFILSSLRHAHWGANLGGALPVLVSLVVLIGGSLAAKSNPHVRPQLLTFLFTSLLGALVPLVIPLAGEVRAMLWLIPLYCICAVALIGKALLSPPPLRWLGAAAFVALIASELLANFWIATTPSQPIRDALAITKKLADQGHPVIGIYMGTREGAALYGGINLLAYQLNPDSPPREDSLPSLKQAETRIAQLPGDKAPYAVVFFEYFVQRDEPDLWQYLQKNYQVVERLPGRLSSAAIYQRKTTPTTQP